MNTNETTTLPVPTCMLKVECPDCGAPTCGCGAEAAR